MDYGPSSLGVQRIVTLVVIVAERTVTVLIFVMSNAVGTSTSTPETVHAIGGPDISAKLLTVRTTLLKWYSALPAGKQAAFRSEWVTSVAGMVWDAKFNRAKLNAQIGLWDILALQRDFGL